MMSIEKQFLLQQIEDSKDDPTVLAATMMRKGGSIKDVEQYALYIAVTNTQIVKQLRDELAIKNIALESRGIKIPKSGEIK